ncbi:MAG: HlyD family secretion protein [Vulcanimicrobiaceae bacterium]
MSGAPRRGFPWFRLALVVTVLAVSAYLLIPNFFYVSADALVQGDLVPVTTLFVARINRLYAKCDDRVVAGQKVADVSNFLVQANYQEQYLLSLRELILSQNAFNEGIDAARSTAEASRAKFQEYSTAANRLRQVFVGYDRAYKADAIGRVEWEAKREEWQAALALAESARLEWVRDTQHVHRVESDSRAKIASAQREVRETHSIVDRMGSEALRAPTAGFVVDCNQRPGNVINPGDPMINIFDPNRAYVLAYFNTSSIDKVRIGQRPEIILPGFSQPVTGRVSAIYPTLSKLPDDLTRYFWQHVQWSEYRPVRIELDGISREERDRLSYDTQARVRIRIRNSWNSPTVVGQSSAK